MRKFVIGDIHGRVEALKEVLQLSGFDYDKDKLIILGDVCDGGYNTYEVVEKLLKIKNRIFIMGNHDEWFMNHIRIGWAEEIWMQQGGANTLRSYGAEVAEGQRWDDDSKIITKELHIPITHQEFFNSAVFYHIEDNMVFVHGGFNPKNPMEEQDKFMLLWDRTLIERCKNGLKTEWDKIFVGHTTMKSKRIERYGQLYCMDTGAGWDGKLTIMDIATEEYWQSKQQTPAINEKENHTQIKTKEE